MQEPVNIHKRFKPINLSLIVREPSRRLALPGVKRQPPQLSLPANKDSRALVVVTHETMLAYASIESQD
jgi:hypothetical protein